MNIRLMFKKKHKSSNHRASGNHLIPEVKFSYKFSLFFWKLPTSALLLYICLTILLRVNKWVYHG